MSPNNDRIAAPTNGRRPQPDPDPIEPDAPERSTPEGSTPGASAVPFSPTQLVVGFAILASIVAVLARQLRRRRDRSDSRDDG